MEELPIKDLEEFIKKMNSLKEKEKLDLSSQEDLSLAIMNLISLEEHFFFTGEKTQKNQYFEFLRQVRNIRKALLKKLLKNTEGEVWCISKHLLSASMRLMEVGTKKLDEGKIKEAEDLFKKSFDIYNLFWGINLGIVKINNFKKISDNALNKNDKKGRVLEKLGEILKKIIDCCKE